MVLSCYIYLYCVYLCAWLDNTYVNDAILYHGIFQHNHDVYFCDSNTCLTKCLHKIPLQVYVS